MYEHLIAMAALYLLAGALQRKLAVAAAGCAYCGNPEVSDRCPTCGAPS